MTLTTAPGGDAGQLAYHCKMLRQRVERHLGFTGMAHFQLQTAEGHAVIHALWFWSGQRTFYIDQKYLSTQWADIHGAPIVWLKKAALNEGLARYLVSQYVQGQEALVPSWRRLFRFPLVQVWGWWRSVWKDRPYSEMLKAWQRLLGGEIVGGLPPPLVEVSRESIAAVWASFDRGRVRRPRPGRIRAQDTAD